ncbi:cytochrome P450 [Xylariaceae sp. FL0255]|nr:cytochrome P450 [Xylariaceae sp. FL0255]
MALQAIFNISWGFALSLFVVYCLVLCSYRLICHPLRRYPGPLFARISGLYGAFYASQRRLHIVTRQDHLQYGRVIRQGPNKLVFNSPQALRDIYSSDRVEKSQIYKAGVLGPHFNLFNIIDKNAHAKKRKVVGAVLSLQSMRTFEPIMAEQIGIFIEYLKVCAIASKAVDISTRTKYLTMDVVGHLAFGYSLNLQTESRNRNLILGIQRSNHRLNIWMQSSLFVKIRLEIFPYFALLMKKGSHLKIVQTMIKARLAEEKHARNDLFSSVTNAANMNPEDSITLSEIWSEAGLFFPAGGESISTATSSLFFYLSRNPDSYHKLRDEVRKTFDNSNEICGGPKLTGCEYLRACIDEAMRLAPPAPGTLWRERASSDDRSRPFTIDGHAIPEGTIFGVNTYALHHDEHYFPQPFSFKPERWLSSHTPESEIKVMRTAFAPFSQGYRGCAGKAMAYLEASLIIAKTIWHFDFSTATGDLGKIGGGTGLGCELNGREREDEFQLDDILTAAHRGPYLMFQLRESTRKE